MCLYEVSVRCCFVNLINECDGGDKGWLSHYAPDASQAGFLTCAKPHSDSVEWSCSSIVNEGIRAILNLFIFFLQEDFTHPKSTQSTKTWKVQKAQKAQKA